MSSFVSADGSPLVVYLALPPGDTPAIVDGVLGHPSTILELGSGPGRVSKPLAALGHTVTAVDDSPQMLEHVKPIESVCADLFTLDLERKFDAVLAASHLINRPDGLTPLLDVCSRHVKSSGVVLVERYTPGWLFQAQHEVGQAGPVEIEFTPGDVDGGILSATVVYKVAGEHFVQAFEAVDVDDETLADSAARASMVIDDTSADGRWVVLRPS